MNLWVAVAVGLFVAGGVLAYMADSSRSTECGNHHFEEYSPPLGETDIRIRGHVKGKPRHPLRGGVLVVEVKERARCEHESCRETDTKWEELGKTQSAGKTVEEVLHSVID